MPQPDTTEQFVQQLAEHQSRLFGYVYSMLGDHSRAADVLQETNLVLWRKNAEFDPDPESALVKAHYRAQAVLAKARGETS